jgi:hypothetical protein
VRSSGVQTALLRQGAVSVTLPVAVAWAAATTDPSPIIGSSKLRFRRLRQTNRQPRPLPSPCQAAPEGSAVTAPPSLLRQEGPCRFDGCAKHRVAGGSCAGHAAQYYSGRPLAPLWKPKVGCDFPACEKRQFALGFCEGHWRQLREKRLAVLNSGPGRGGGGPAIRLPGTPIRLPGTPIRLPGTPIRFRPPPLPLIHRLVRHRVRGGSC